MPHIPMRPIPNNVQVFDNGGLTCDRFTIYFPDGSVHTMSTNALSPIGVCMYAGQEKDWPKAKAGKRRFTAPVHVCEQIINLLT